MSVLCGAVAVSFLLLYDLPLQRTAEADTYGTRCELSLNANNKVFKNGDSVIIYGNSPYNTELGAAMLPVSDEHLYTKAVLFKSQGCHYTHLLGTFSNNKTGYYWIAITEADITGIKPGDPRQVKVIFYLGKH